MKFLIIYKKYIRSVCFILALMLLLSINFYGVPAASVYLGYAPRLIPIYNVETDKKQIALTFDSAWGADKTTSIISTLKSYGVTATFFLVGFWAEDYPDMVKALDDAGIEIGTHSNTHPDLTTLSSAQISLELTTSINTIKNVTGKDISLFRAPYGAYNNNLLTITNNLGLKTIQWDVDTLDWKGISGVEICERVMSRVKNGSIILCHNNSDHILDALPLMLERLIQEKYELVHVSDLIYADNYTIDHTGKQILNTN